MTVTLQGIPLQGTFVLGALFGACLLLITGLYCIIISKNMIRILIGIELVAKALTLVLIAAGRFTGQHGLGQALVITLIVVEVVVVAIAAGVVIGAYHRTGSLHVGHLQKLKG